ncbi:hypothetical protein HYH02_006570 [Chlamydomonas schloesseri]|uniref:non-specific serine/threonine protein kinase n=1 Tax=Chlamydomonas schloesseri TaxID=2026947 RepID=A0A835T508_9CHLO|nr:hypothetical protein HYH02_006570 [Chlamydomonas schloesseri]|eukprot:KAG2439042.1 hypothetical protein HYH02_006570 [Chlamydomonas schloesseri]
MATEEGLRDREQQEGYRAPRVTLTIKDFDVLGRIGDGSFSTVFLARQKSSGKQYAIKMMNKHLVMRNKMVEYIKNERFILDKFDDAGIAKLHFTFQDPDNLYMGMEYCAGGELYEQINKRGRLPLEAARFYAAEVVLILEYLRKAQVVHRDLKPENLLLSAQGHLKLIDFGSARAFFLPAAEKPPGKQRATSFVGTAEYVSPEVLLNAPLSYPADLWALGCMLYQMIVGRPPFKAASEYLTFQKITDRDFAYPGDPGYAADGEAEEDDEDEEEGGNSDAEAAAAAEAAAPRGEAGEADAAAAAAAAGGEGAGSSGGAGAGAGPAGKMPKLRGPVMYPDDARDLTDRLLAMEPLARIGAEDIAELKAHPFFAGVDWARLRSGPAPPYLPPRPPGGGPGSDGYEEGLDWELTSLVRDAAES